MQKSGGLLGRKKPRATSNEQVTRQPDRRQTFLSMCGSSCAVNDPHSWRASAPVFWRASAPLFCLSPLLYTDSLPLLKVPPNHDRLSHSDRKVTLNHPKNEPGSIHCNRFQNIRFCLGRPKSASMLERNRKTTHPDGTETSYSQKMPK